MRQKADIEIGSRHVAVPRWMIVVAAMLVLGAGGMFAYQLASGDLEDYADEQQQVADAKAYQVEVDRIEIALKGCESNNVLRQAAWENSIIDAKTRYAAADQYSDAAREKILHYADRNIKAAQRLVDSVADVALKPGSPKRDCAGLYPAPEVPEGVEPIPPDTPPAATP